MTDEDLWKRIKPHALNDDEFIKKLDDRQIQGVAWKFVKWVFASLLGAIMVYAPAKVIEWFNSHVTVSK